MTKLMEQVKEIQRRAHVCPECEGKKEIEFDCEDAPDGTVEAPDIDALVGAIEVLEKFLVADWVAMDHVLSCPVCRDKNSDVCDKGEQLLIAKRYRFIQCQELVCNGLPGEGVNFL
jgi:hypothetical protein